MKTKIQSIITEFVTSRIAVVTAILCAVVVGGGVVLAYGPARPTYTVQHPADHITFNSITNNPNYGDERNFTIIRDASVPGTTGWKDSITAENGKEYTVRVYVHNNAASNLNLVARNTRVMVNVPNTTANSIQLDGFITADNASPKQIWDSAVMTSDKKFNVSYVQGSASYFNNLNPANKISDSIVTSAGALVGYNSMDGNVPGCYEYSGAVTFKVKVNVPSPDFTVEKKVRLSGTTTWQKSITANPGQKVDYQIGYDNVGTATQSNVVAQDTLPANVGYTAGSTTLKNGTNNTGNGLAITSNNLVTPTGINIGNYGAGTNAFVRFSATLPAEDKLVCGPNQLVNAATVSTQNGSKSDTATVTVNKTCAPGTPVTPVTALPTTGPVEVVAGLVGIAAITVGVVYYYKSRRDLEHALHEAQAHPTGKTVADHHPLIKK